MKKRCAFMCFLVMYIGLFCFLGLYTFPQADDYNIANMVNRYGFWQAQVQWYLNWPVSPVYQVLVSAVTLANFKLYNALQFVTCLMNICVLYGVLRVTVKNLDRGRTFLIALLMQAVWLAVATGLSENFYWMDAIGYTWNGTFLLLTSALLIAVLKKGTPDVKLIVACSALLFITGEFGPQVGSFLCAALFGLFCICLLERKKSASVYFFGAMYVAFAGFLVLYFSPGTAARMSVSGDLSKNILQTFGVAAVFGSITALKFFTKPVIYLTILYSPVIAAHAEPFDSIVSKHLRAWHIFVLVALIAPFQQAIAGFATGAGLPARAEGLAIWTMGTAWLFLWAFGYRNEAAFDKIRSLRIYPWRGVLLTLCLLLNGNFISLLRDLHVAPLYAAEQKQREALVTRQKAEGKTDIVVPSLTVKPKLLFFTDLRPSSYDWKNQSYAQYWGIHSVSALPAPLLNDEGARRDFLEGKPESMEALADAGDPEAQFMLGEIYDTTFASLSGTPKNNATAAQWYLLAAQQQYAPAQRRLSRFYALGMGVPQNYFYAVGWLLRSQF
jgi:hypothetical protein